MQSRNHFLEVALEKSIQSKDFESSVSLIKAIQKSKKASLVNFDAEGRSFLLLALEAGEKKIADMLLSSQENNDEILFKRDQYKKTILNTVIIQGYSDMATKLIDIAANKNKMDIYLEADSDGFTVLHLAALHGRDQIVELLLKKIMITDKPIEFINQVNGAGDTALHLAFTRPTHLSIKSLIEHGAKLYLRNNKQINPVKLFSLLEKELQEDIFNSINKDKQDDILRLYKKIVLETQTLNDTKSIYFKLSGLSSLSALLIAHHEFNPAIPIRASHLINDDLLPKMPIYAEKIFRAEKSPLGESITFKEKTRETNDLIPPSSSQNNEILDEDRVTLSSLIDDIESYLADLRLRPTISSSNRTLAVVMSLVGLFIYLVVESWLIYKAYTSSPSSRGYFFVVSALWGTCGAIALIFSSLLWKSLWNKEINISQNEWNPLINRLQKDILEKLMILEEMEKNTNVNYLPTQSQNVHHLNNQITELGQVDKNWGFISSDSQPISKVINTLTQVKNIIKTIRQDLNLSRKPLSLLFSPLMKVTVDSDSDYDSEDELLPRKAIKSMV